MEKEMCKVQFVERFDDYYEFKQDNIILNTIRIALLNEYDQIKMIPFDIQVSGEKGFRVRPYSLKGNFLIMYECIMDAYKVTVLAEKFHLREKEVEVKNC